MGSIHSSFTHAVWECKCWELRGLVTELLVGLGRKGVLGGVLGWTPPTLLLPACALRESAHTRADPPLRAAGFRKLLVSSAHSHMGRSQNHLFFAWRLLSSHRRPSLAFFHCEREMGTGPAFPSSTPPKLQQGRQQVSSWHLSSCLEEAPVANLAQPHVPGGARLPPGLRCFRAATLKARECV